MSSRLVFFFSRSTISSSANRLYHNLCCCCFRWFFVLKMGRNHLNARCFSGRPSKAWHIGCCCSASAVWQFRFVPEVLALVAGWQGHAVAGSWRRLSVMSECAVPRSRVRAAAWSSETLGLAQGHGAEMACRHSEGCDACSSGGVGWMLSGDRGWMRFRWDGLGWAGIRWWRFRCCRAYGAAGSWTPSGWAEEAPLAIILSPESTEGRKSTVGNCRAMGARWDCTDAGIERIPHR